jgi:hypothetical protein
MERYAIVRQRRRAASPLRPTSTRLVFSFHRSHPSYPSHPSYRSYRSYRSYSSPEPHSFLRQTPRKTHKTRQLIPGSHPSEEQLGPFIQPVTEITETRQFLPFRPPPKTSGIHQHLIHEQPGLAPGRRLPFRDLLQIKSAQAHKAGLRTRAPPIRPSGPFAPVGRGRRRG